jgi:hypothetical protein
VTTPCDPPKQQVGRACFDPSGHAAEWTTVNESSATSNSPGYDVSFTYTLPQTIAPGGENKLILVAKVTSRDNAGPHARFCAVLPFAKKENGEPCATTAAALKGETKDQTTELTLLPNENPAGAKATLTIGFEEPGGHLDFTYEATAEQGSTKTVAEPAPGGSVTASSPKPVPAGATKVGVTVASSGGDLKGTTIVGKGELAQKLGEAVAACWLIGPDAIPTNDAALKSSLSSVAANRFWSHLKPEQQLRLCIFIVFHLDRSNGFKPRSTQSAAGGCRARRLAFAIRTRNGRIASVRLAKSALTATSVRYSCTAAGGKTRITVDGRTKGGLRKMLGTKLDLGVVRAKTAPSRGAKLTFTFGW